ncbi:MAG: hypothetical protein H0U60_19550 [Blastocatellia bacterium]|nr:hypothetical protein [Blastocatellia bacterium]
MTGGRYEFNPSAVTASIEVFPKGEYEFQVGEPKAFAKEGDDEGKGGNFGVRFPIVIKAPGQYEGKRTVSSIYFHSEGGRSFAKQFMMAVMGYGKGETEEKRFDADMTGKDWSANYEGGDVGQAYREMTGMRVIGQLDITKNNRTGEPMQQFKSWRPIGGEPIAQ